MLWRSAVFLNYDGLKIFFTFRFEIRENLLQNRNTPDAQDPVRIELRLRIPDDPFFGFFRSVARF
jgi:hypothetical protein